MLKYRLSKIQNNHYPDDHDCLWSSMVRYSPLSDRESTYLIIFMLLDAKVKIIKYPDQPLSGWPWLSMVVWLILNLDI